MWQPGRWHKVCQQYVFTQSWSFMQSTAEGSRDHSKWVAKRETDLISTNSSQCARRITLPVRTTEASVRNVKSCLKYHLRGKREGRKKTTQYLTRKYSIKNQGTATSKAESWQVIKPRAHPHLENCGLLWHWKGKTELERVQRRGIPKEETNSPGSFGTEKRQLKEKKADIESVIEDVEKVPRE